MGKKTTHNAYYYFMTELRDRQPQQYPNLQAVSEVAGRLWQQMSHAQRQPYVDMASKRKNSGVRYTSTGVSIDEIKKRQQEAALKEQQMKDDIKQTINMAAATNRLQEQMFHIIHTNYFYHQSFVKYYVPAEIAVARFTLADGVKPENVFHMMIHPACFGMERVQTAKHHRNYMRKRRSEQTADERASINEARRHICDERTPEDVEVENQARQQ